MSSSYSYCRNSPLSEQLTAENAATASTAALQILIIAGDIVPKLSISAEDRARQASPLPHRRQFPDVPRIPCADSHGGWRDAAERRRRAHQRGVHLRDDAPEASDGPQTGVHRRVVRPAGTHLSRRSGLR